MISAELLRYGVAVLIGLAIDLLVSYALMTYLSLPMVLSAAGGFCCGLIVNYINFEKWVFGRGPLSWGAFCKVLIASQAALLVRLATVWLLTQFALLPMMIFFIATGTSFVTNFFLSRLAIVRK